MNVVITSAMSLRLGTLSSIHQAPDQGSMKLVEVLGFSTGQILKLSNLTEVDSYKSFECKELLLHSDNCITRIIVVYRPPISVKNDLTHAAFLNEFSTLLERPASVLARKFTLKWRFQFPC